MSIREMIAAHPHVDGNTNDALIRAIEASYDCAQTCTVCADACLGEDEKMLPRLLQCIRLTGDCADICNAAGRIASRRTGSDEATIKEVLLACAASAKRCGDECEKHVDKHEHCRICMESCRTCEEACRVAADSIAA